MPHSAHIATERAIDDWRRQSGLLLVRDTLGKAALPVEYAPACALPAFKAMPEAVLLLTAARAGALALTGGDSGGVAIALDGLDEGHIHTLSDPLAEKVQLPSLSIRPPRECEAILLRLARHAAILPALLAGDVAEGASLPLFCGWQKLTCENAGIYLERPLLGVIPSTMAWLPVEVTEKARMVAFHVRASTAVHIALLVGEPEKQEAPLVRVHSSCATGDIFASRRCDCGSQLHRALDRLAQEGSGILLYLHQEGRGIGLANKLRAYRLQEMGFDTYEANLMLGFGEDERDFAVAGEMLRALGAPRIRLLTNNPHKMAAMQRTGITVSERVAIIGERGEHNKAYLEAKSVKFGHYM